MEELANFKISSKIDSSQYIDDNIRMVSFNFIKKQSQQNMYKLVVKTFDLIERKTIFIEKLRELIATHFYKEVNYIRYLRRNYFILFIPLFF